MKYLVLCLALFSCSFKDSPPPPPADPTPSTETITVRWKAGEQEFAIKRSLNHQGSLYEAETPVTLSNPVPASIALEGSLALTGSVYVESALASRDGASFTLAGNFRDGQLELSGLRSILSDNQDQKAEILLHARDQSGATPWTMKLTLLTLPSRVGVETLPASSAPKISKLVAPNLRLDLIRILKIKNDKAFPLRLTPKGRWLSGHIERHFIHYGVSNGSCSFQQLASNYSESFQGQFVILPVSNNLGSSWPARAFEASPDFVIPAKSESTLGLFGTGAKVTEVMDHGFQYVQPALVNVNDHCERSCAPDVHPLQCQLVPIAGTGREGNESRDAVIVFDRNSNQVAQAFDFGASGEGPSQITDLLPSTISFP